MPTTDVNCGQVRGPVQFAMARSVEPIVSQEHSVTRCAVTTEREVAVSVEGQRVKGRPYQLILSLFRQDQIVYVIGDERDVVGLRGAIWKFPVYFYPARTNDKSKRANFADMMKEAAAKAESE